jgi:thioesterase domain-containing protein/acyl carrier protein
LGIEQVGIHDNFFDLGGDSLLAVQLMSKLGETLQVSLSTHSLLNAPTIAALAELIEETISDKLSYQPARLARPSSLVEIQPGNGPKSPLFLIHPVGGHVYFYRELAHHLGSEQPVYGLQAQGLNGETAPLSRVEDMATHYLEALRLRQPEGPYFIGGSSFGGMVAFEMAQQFHALGQQVALLAMIDTPGLGQMPAKFSDEAEEILAYLLEGTQVFGSTDEVLRLLERNEQLRYFVKQMKMADWRLPEFDMTQLRHFIHLFKANSQAMFSYRPKVYPGKIIFCRAQERDSVTPEHPEYGWIELAVKGIEIYEVPGNHITMNYPPHVQLLAERLRVCLKQAQAGR